VSTAGSNNDKPALTFFALVALPQAQAVLYATCARLALNL